MLRYRSVANSTLIKYGAITFAFFPLLLALFLIFMDKGDVRQWILFSFAFVFVVIIGVLDWCVFKNAYQVFEISENGVKNRHLSLNFEDIKNIQTVQSIKLYYITFVWEMKIPPVICIGSPSLKPFQFQNVKENIFIPLTQKNLNILFECNAGRSKVLDDFIALYKYRNE